MIKTTVSAALFAFLVTEASAQQRSVYDARGNVVGRAATDSGGTVTNYDERGKLISRESTSGNTTTIYDAGGRLLGRGHYSTTR